MPKSKISKTKDYKNLSQTYENTDRYSADIRQLPKSGQN